MVLSTNIHLENNDPTMKPEQALQKTLPKLNKKSIFSESEYCDSYQKCCKIARPYLSQKK